MALKLLSHFRLCRPAWISELCLTNLFDILLTGTAHAPDKVAVFHSGRSITYRELVAAAARVGEVLERLPRGSRVGISLVVIE